MRHNIGHSTPYHYHPLSLVELSMAILHVQPFLLWLYVLPELNCLVSLLYESPNKSLGKCVVLFFIGTYIMKLYVIT